MIVCTSGLGRVRRAGKHCPGSRSGSSPVSGRQQWISLFSNTACSMLLSLLPATRCSKCDTSHHLFTETRSGVSSHEEQAMLCHPEKPLPQGWVGVTTPMPQTITPLQGHRSQLCRNAEPHPATCEWMAMSDLQGQRKILNSGLCF